ncbi:MAG TPA: NAD(P)/FAD-dependent oxidoreductase [Gammaproteobacteria bacterium]
MEDGEKLFDALIVGGGPGGLAAAYYLARFRRSVRVLDSGESRAAWVPVTHNHAGFPKGIEGPELLERMRRQVLDAGGRIDHTRVEDARQVPGSFMLETRMGPVHGRTLLLATGVVDVKPELPDLVDAVRDGLVRYCPVCDAYEARGKDILVLGSGESGFGEADFLRDFSDRVTVLTQGIQVDPGSPAYLRLEDRQVQVIEQPLAKLAADTEGGRIRLTLTGGHELDFDLVYSAMGCTPRNDLATRLQVEIGEDQRIVTDGHQETSVRNCFAAGDVVQGLNQISVAIGQAAVAATTMHNRLREASRREDRADP